MTECSAGLLDKMRRFSCSRRPAPSSCTARRGHLQLWEDHAGEVLLHPEHGGRQPSSRSDRQHRAGYMGHPESAIFADLHCIHVVARPLSMCPDLTVVVILGMCSGGLAHFELWDVVQLQPVSGAWKWIQQRHCARRHACGGAATHLHPCKH